MELVIISCDCSSDMHLMSTSFSGLANLFAGRPGVHVIEVNFALKEQLSLNSSVACEYAQLMTGRHLNVLSTARMGMAYHGVITNSTKEGESPIPVSRGRFLVTNAS